jgi:hypothetical protein
MDNQPKTTYRNALLQRLSPLDLALLAPHLEPVDLPLRTSLETSKSVIEYVYLSKRASRLSSPKYRRAAIPRSA